MRTTPGFPSKQWLLYFALGTAGQFVLVIGCVALPLVFLVCHGWWTAYTSKAVEATALLCGGVLLQVLSGFSFRPTGDLSHPELSANANWPPALLCLSVILGMVVFSMALATLKTSSPNLSGTTTTDSHIKAFISGWSAILWILYVFNLLVGIVAFFAPWSQLVDLTWWRGQIRGPNPRTQYWLVHFSLLSSVQRRGTGDIDPAPSGRNCAQYRGLEGQWVPRLRAFQETAQPQQSPEGARITGQKAL